MAEYVVAFRLTDNREETETRAYYVVDAVSGDAAKTTAAATAATDFPGVRKVIYYIGPAPAPADATLVSSDVINSVMSANISSGALDGVAIGTTTRASAIVGTYLANAVEGAQLTYTFNSAPDAYNKGPLWLRARWTGTITTAASGTAGEIAMSKVLFQDQSATTDGPISALLVNYSAPGNSTTGNQSSRRGITSKMQVTGAYGDASGDDEYIVFCPFQAEVYSDVNQGGTGSWPATPGGDPPNGPYSRGELMGGNDLALLKSGATHWRGLVGREITVSVATGASVIDKIGLHIGKKDDDQVAATLDESAIEISSQAGAIGWKVGLAFGSQSGADSWPMASTGTLIGAELSQWPTITTRADNTAAYGVDFRNVTFSGAPFISTGFRVTDAGNIVATPAASATPANNGEMTFELTSNTSLKIKVKGSDGTVRSVTLTLA